MMCRRRRIGGDCREESGRLRLGFLRPHEDRRNLLLPDHCEAVERPAELEDFYRPLRWWHQGAAKSLTVALHRAPQDDLAKLDVRLEVQVVKPVLRVALIKPGEQTPFPLVLPSPSTRRQQQSSCSSVVRFFGPRLSNRPLTRSGSYFTCDGQCSSSSTTKSKSKSKSKSKPRHTPWCLCS